MRKLINYRYISKLSNELDTASKDGLDLAFCICKMQNNHPQTMLYHFSMMVERENEVGSLYIVYIVCFLGSDFILKLTQSTIMSERAILDRNKEK